MASIRKRGPHQFQARVRLKGYPPLERTFRTRIEAVRWGEQTTTDLLRGTTPPVAVGCRISLGDALRRYSLEVTPLKKSARQEAGRIRLWLAHPLSERQLHDVRGADLARWRDQRLSKGAGANTIRLELALISHVYEVARRDWGEPVTNPIGEVRKPRLPRGRDRRLQRGEEDQLLGYCRRESPWLAPIVTLAIQTAMRRSEILSLTWERIDLDARVARLEDTKNGDVRVVPLSTSAVAALSSVPRTGSRVFQVHPDSVTWTFRKACVACGISGLRFHDLRHEAASRLFERGLNVMEVATVTGHRSMQMLKRYTHLKAEDLVHRLG